MSEILADAVTHNSALEAQFKAVFDAFGQSPELGRLYERELRKTFRSALKKKPNR